ncbi:hypothetical protein JCM8547_003418 [Rhodosporidiobolus lusitaniae]
MPIQEACLVGLSTASEVDSFLSQYAPSKNSLEHGPWYWVQLPQPGAANAKSSKPAEDRVGAEDSFVEEGQKLEQHLRERCEWIKENAPVRGKKKEGIKSQKELREQEYEVFNKGVEKLAKKHNVFSGKWLFRPGGDVVDAWWSKIVKAVALEDGPLAKAGVLTARVSTTAGEGDQHVICVYCRDSWDDDNVGEVFKTLVSELSLVSMSYKCDANTILGIDSKHSSKIPSSLYTKKTFADDKEIEKLLEKNRAPKKEAPKKKTLEEEVASGKADGFETDSGSESEEERPRKKAKAK